MPPPQSRSALVANFSFDFRAGQKVRVWRVPDPETSSIRLIRVSLYDLDDRHIASVALSDTGLYVAAQDGEVVVPEQGMANYDYDRYDYDRYDYDRSIADYDRAIQLKPDDPDTYVNRGWAFHAQGDYDRAIADYDRAIQLKPDYALAYANRGEAYRFKRDYDHAIADLDQGHPAQAGQRLGLRLPRLGLQRQGRLRPRHR